LTDPYRQEPLRYALPARLHCLFCGGIRASAVSGCETCGATPDVCLSPVTRGERLDCPRCAVTLVEAPVDEPELFQCPACLGAFAPVLGWCELLERVRAGEPAPLSRFIPLPTGRELSRAQLIQPTDCPRCHKPNERIAFAVRSSVVADVCAAHGIWFDAAEIVGAVSFVRECLANGGMIP
jgi:Zn-finger nucleic acid-binding protein